MAKIEWPKQDGLNRMAEIGYDHIFIHYLGIINISNKTGRMTPS